jgi:hypothetical protein
MLMQKISKRSYGYILKICSYSCDKTTTKRPTTNAITPPMDLFNDQVFNQGSPNKAPAQPNPVRPAEVPARPVEGPRRTAAQAEDYAVEVTKGHSSYCFAADQEVTTADGPKRMDQLKTGDRVLTESSLFGSPVYQSVDWFLHRDTQQWATFYRLATTEGRSVKLTGKHMLPIVPCDFESLDATTRHLAPYLKPAEQVQLNECALVNDETAPVQRITAISTSVEQGIYAPFTQQGSIVVNGIHTSCHAAVSEYSMIQTSVMKLSIPIYRRIGQLLGVDVSGGINSNSKNGDLPGVIKMLIEVAKIL